MGVAAFAVATADDSSKGGWNWNEERPTRGWDGSEWDGTGSWQEWAKDWICGPGLNFNPFGPPWCIAGDVEPPPPTAAPTPDPTETSTPTPQPTLNLCGGPDPPSFCDDDDDDDGEGDPDPTADPTVNPTVEPTVVVTAEPTVEPTVVVTAEPTVRPTVVVTAEPTVVVTAEPTVEPTVVVTAEPTVRPTVVVTPTAGPTSEPENTDPPPVVPCNSDATCSNLVDNQQQAGMTRAQKAACFDDYARLVSYWDDIGGFASDPGTKCRNNRIDSYRKAWRRERSSRPSIPVDIRRAINWLHDNGDDLAEDMGIQVGTVIVWGTIEAGNAGSAVVTGFQNGAVQLNEATRGLSEHDPGAVVWAGVSHPEVREIVNTALCYEHTPDIVSGIGTGLGAVPHPAAKGVGVTLEVGASPAITWYQVGTDNCQTTRPPGGHPGPFTRSTGDDDDPLDGYDKVALILPDIDTVEPVVVVPDVLTSPDDAVPDPPQELTLTCTLQKVRAEFVHSPNDPAYSDEALAAGRWVSYRKQFDGQREKWGNGASHTAPSRPGQTHTFTVEAYYEANFNPDKGSEPLTATITC